MVDEGSRSCEEEPPVSTEIHQPSIIPPASTSQTVRSPLDINTLYDGQVIDEEINDDSQMLSLSDIHAQYEHALLSSALNLTDIDTPHLQTFESGTCTLNLDTELELTDRVTQYQHLYHSGSLQLDSETSVPHGFGMKKVKLTNVDKASQTLLTGEILCTSENVYTGSVCCIHEDSFLTQTLLTGKLEFCSPYPH